MSDKSFGDHPNRNVVKNPLLSSAVTGLSIEDLTHKAVLLPVTPSQGQITRPDQQQGTQTRTLGHPEHGTATLPSGDAFQSITLSNTTPIPKQNTTDNKNIVKLDSNRSATQSKASVKSDDDFDVNEYIARLQGTRYVSAPLHSHLKEDKNADLEAREENLEEINLNDSQGPVEVQQSLTADIAQNFSQLPTVLPHVASAVFSSFSNMLSYKSREQTPDVNPTVDQRKYDDVQLQKPDTAVPLQVEEYSAPKEVGPPPKEPPVGGTSNFRLTTKKKYAQIPGLSSGESAQAMTFGGPPPNMPFGQNIPSFDQSFPPTGQHLPPIGQNVPAMSQNLPPIGQNVPSMSQNMVPIGQNVPPTGYNMLPASDTQFAKNEPHFVEKETGIDLKPPSFVQSAPIGQNSSAFVPNMPSTGQNLPKIFNPNDSKLDNSKPDAQNVFATQLQSDTFNASADNKNVASNIVTSESVSKASVFKDGSNFFTPIDHKENIPSNIQGSTSIIPPPPMFSNLPKKDSQSIATSILPPSVARRISANQPRHKRRIPGPALTENIAVLMGRVVDSPDQEDDFLATDFETSPSSTYGAVSPPTQRRPATEQKDEKPSEIPSFFVPKEIVPSVSSSESDATVQMISTLTPAMPSSYPINAPNVASSLNSTIYNPNTAIMGPSASIPPVSHNIFTPEVGIKSDTSSHQTSQNIPPPPTFFNPTMQADSNTQHPITQLPPHGNTEPIRSIPEPPKAAASNFRMTKKRPQYYAGPIDGVGAISNSVKPIIPPVMPINVERSDLQGTLFTPAQVEQATEQLTATNIEATSIPFDINKPTGNLAQEKPIEFNMPQDYSAFHLRQSQNQTYEQDYNTAFDLSRATTEAFDAPKQESKGFGIIGTLKSTLGAIDINKFQNTVTTFFDPAYNNTKVPDLVGQENESLLQPGYNNRHAHQQHFGTVDQSNLDIFVASLDRSHHLYQNPAQESNQYYRNQSQYYGQDLYSSSYFSDSNTNQQASANVSVQSYAQENPGNINFISTDASKNTDGAFYNPNTFVQSSSYDTSANTNQGKDTLTQQNFHLQEHENKNQYPLPTHSQQNVGQYNPSALMHTPEKLMPDQQTSNVNLPLKAAASYSKPDIGEPITYTYQDPKQSEEISFYNPDAFTSTQEKQQIFDATTSDTRLGPYQSFRSSSNIHEIASEKELQNAEGSCDSALNTNKYNYSSIQTPPLQSRVPLVSADSFFDSPHTLSQLPTKSEDIDLKKSESPLLKTVTTPSNAFFETSATVDAPIFSPIGSNSKGEVKTFDINKEEHKERNLIESLSKDEIPVLGVSSAPLFGLAALLADKAKKQSDAENVSLIAGDTSGNIFEDNSGASFFDSTTKGNKQHSNVPKDPSELDISVLKISDVKNVLLMEPPQDNIGAVLKRNASSNKLESQANIEKVVPEQFGQNVTSTSFKEHGHTMFADNKNDCFFKHETEETDNGKLQQDDELDNVAMIDSSELNICETCREVKTPDLSLESKPHEAEDVTTQLIENITSRIRLSNPLTVPFTENASGDDILELNDQQIQEITNIAEETIETLNVQSATKLLDDDIALGNVQNYEWTEDSAFPSTATGNIDFTQAGATATNELTYGFKIDADIATANIDHDYDFKIDPNAIGFFGNNSLFFDNLPQNASDEIKAEIKNSHEDIVLPRQMSIPSAPPAEDDTKSDETGGLDVQSIEQDAKKDFPLDEEFIIEPSETDDDKIEFRERKRSSEDSTAGDTFTNRIERFKKAADHLNDDIFGQKDAQVFNVPPISMASYFDTGNYAVDSHYKNSMSPIQMPLNTYRQRPSYEYVSIPPGFEEQYMNRLKNMANPDAPLIPDATTQTPQTVTATTDISSENTTNVMSYEMVEGKKTVTPQMVTFKTEPSTSGIVSEPLQVIPQSSDLIAQGSVQNVQSLPDPVNFFTSEAAKPAEQEEPDSFNRLASYFSMPPAQPDHSKSFFELSESQNHYRHGNEITEEKDNGTTLFERNQNHGIDDITKNNIANLMLDLTSPKNLHKQIVTTINHFTVEYDTTVQQNANARPIKIDLPNTDPKTQSPNSGVNLDKNPLTAETKTDADTNAKTDAKLVEDCEDSKVVFNCKYCADLVPGLKSEFKVRTAMNESKPTESNEVNMMSENDSNGRSSVTINFGNDSDQESHHGISILNEQRVSSEYTPVKHHWFYRVDVEEKSVWRGFSSSDSHSLEETFNSPDLDENTLVATDGGRYDVNIVGRLRIAVYWKEKPTNVRRCSWFYKGTTDPRYVPYTEAVAEKLEEEYRHGITTGVWHRKLSLPNNEMVIMHGPSVMVHFLQSGATDAFSTPPQAAARPRVVRRGCEEAEIEDCEPSRIDHLLLLCHGVGSACDLRFRSVEEVVDDFRTTSLQLIQSHYKNSYDNGIVNRVEVLPISWHAQLHSGETGIDTLLSRVTLASLPRLRAFTNHTVLDVLFYTSPVFHQTIIDTVCSELNRIYGLFKKRNPEFRGDVSLGGHSLGSVILYDLLCHQTPKAGQSSKKSYVAGTVQYQGGVRYPLLQFHPAALYALGSPIAIFECIRGVESLGADFALPTCRNFFNIFHPYDPIAYRIEPLVNPQLQHVKPSLIPHHKGRKRMHLELKDTMARVGADLKQKLIESVRVTWNKWKACPPTDGQLEKVVEEEMEKEHLCEDSKDEANEVQATKEMLGNLNNGRRIDYVLQEAPLEMINEYLFAMSSHVGYWESEDTMLLMLREVYSSLGVQPDCTVPQQCMTVQRVTESSKVINERENPSTSRGSTS